MADPISYSSLIVTMAPPGLGFEVWALNRQTTFDRRTTQLLKVSYLSLLADRTNGRAIATLLRLSSSVVCDVMYCG